MLFGAIANARAQTLNNDTAVALARAGLSAEATIAKQPAGTIGKSRVALDSEEIAPGVSKETPTGFDAWRVRLWVCRQRYGKYGQRLWKRWFWAKDILFWGGTA